MILAKRPRSNAFYVFRNGHGQTGKLKPTKPLHVSQPNTKKVNEINPKAKNKQTTTPHQNRLPKNLKSQHKTVLTTPISKGKQTNHHSSLKPVPEEPHHQTDTQLTGGRVNIPSTNIYYLQYVHYLHTNQLRKPNSQHERKSQPNWKHNYPPARPNEVGETRPLSPETWTEPTKREILLTLTIFIGITVRKGI